VLRHGTACVAVVWPWAWNWQQCLVPSACSRYAAQLITASEERVAAYVRYVETALLRQKVNKEPWLLRRGMAFQKEKSEMRLVQQRACKWSQ